MKTKLQKLQKQFLKNQNPQPLLDFFETDEYRFASYEDKNYGFITSSKIKKFNKCQLEYKYRYVDMIVPPIDEAAQKKKEDYFTIGQAFDDLLTNPEEFSDKYEVVKRRAGKSDKIEITEGQQKTIFQMKDEFFANNLFRKKPKKRVILQKYKSQNMWGTEFILKAELDDCDSEYVYDLKTTSNILTFDPTSYVEQGAFYSFLANLALDQKLGFRLEVVDKNAAFARSVGFQIEFENLKNYFSKILTDLDRLAEAHETGLFEKTKDWKHLINSPYYSYNGYGRPTEWQEFN